VSLGLDIPAVIQSLCTPIVARRHRCNFFCSGQRACKHIVSQVQVRSRMVPGSGQFRSSAIIRASSKRRPQRFGLGPPGEVTVTQSSTGVSGLAHLNLHNAHDAYALVNVVLLLYVIGQTNTPPSTLSVFTVVAPHQDHSFILCLQTCCVTKSRHLQPKTIRQSAWFSNQSGHSTMFSLAAAALFAAKAGSAH
jgi:hypothetical protein